MSKLINKSCHDPLDEATIRTENVSQDTDQMKMMVRYLRSKSLPAPYLPDWGINIEEDGENLVTCELQEKSTSHTPKVVRPKNKGETVKSHKSHQSHRESQRQSNRHVYSGSYYTGKNVGGGSSTGSTGNATSENSHSDVPNQDLNQPGKISIGEPKKRSDWRTLQQHYYPEGGWGWVVTFCAFASHALALGIQIYLSNIVFYHFKKVWLGSLSYGLSMFLSPLWVSICKRKSTRLASVFGGLIASLGCLFSSFASQFHQICFSYGAFIGVGVGLTRDASSLMVGQYFKKKRELVEIIVVSGSGVGILLISIYMNIAIQSFGWRLGLQAVTVTLFTTFFLGTCYRSASLYHPQRRAILHLKNQRRKVSIKGKGKERRGDDKPPFLDFTCLRSKTLQILLFSTSCTAFGINTPIFYLVKECPKDRSLYNTLVVLNVYVGIAWIIGCLMFGLIIIQKNQDCRVSKQYLCQITGVVCGICIMALTMVQGFDGLVIFCWVYGFSLGGYNYALKVYTYERARARHFPRAWSFVQCSQAVPIMIGIPIAAFFDWSLGELNKIASWKMGYFISAVSVLVGSLLLFLTDFRKRRLSRRKSQNSSMKTTETATTGLDSVQSPKRRLSFSYPIEPLSPSSRQEAGSGGSGSHDPPNIIPLDPSIIVNEDLTCISEEGLGDIDFQDIYFEEWAEYFGDCITSCNKVENCLVSEYDPELAALMDRRNRRPSTSTRPSFAQAIHAGIGATAAAVGGVVGLPGQHLVPSMSQSYSTSGPCTSQNTSAVASPLSPDDSNVSGLAAFRSHLEEPLTNLVIEEEDSNV